MLKTSRELLIFRKVLFCIILLFSLANFFFLVILTKKKKTQGKFDLIQYQAVRKKSLYNVYKYMFSTVQ